MEQTKQTEQWNNGTNETTRQVTKRYKLNYVSPGVGGRRKPVNLKYWNPSFEGVKLTLWETHAARQLQESSWALKMLLPVAARCCRLLSVTGAMRIFAMPADVW